MTWIDEHLGNRAGLERTWDTEWYLITVDAAAATEAEIASCGWLIRRAVARGLTGDGRQLLDIERGGAAQRTLHFVFWETAGREPICSATLDLAVGPDLAAPAVYFTCGTNLTCDVPGWLARYLTAERGTPPMLDRNRLRLAGSARPSGRGSAINPTRSPARVAPLVVGNYIRGSSVDGVISDALYNGGDLSLVVLHWDVPYR